MKIDPSEFDISYFDGLKARAQSLFEHPAGYSRYDRKYPWHRDLYTPLMDRLKPNQYIGKKTLEIACAKGYIVHEWRKLGIDAWGIDISQYAINEAPEEVKDYLSVADARTKLASYSNKEFDLVFSSGFFECLEESELSDVILECNRIARYQYHCFMPDANPTWYLFKPLSWWAEQGFTKNKTLLKVICRDEELLV
ncbi:hypothetical protein ES702_02453 [subsurface metagenome]